MSSRKRLTKILLRTLLILFLIGALIFFSVYISGIGSPKSINGYTKLVADVSETVVRFCERVFYSENKLDDYSRITQIPETENGYVPQGFCYCEAQELYIISYYHSESSSVLVLIDAESNEHIKTISLYDEKDNAFNGHVGGIDDDGEYLYITCDKSVSRVLIDELLNSADSVSLTEYFYTDVKCSYLNCDSEYIYVGEFYTGGGSYNTDKTHHIMYKPFDTSFARVNAYKLSDLNFSNDSDDVTVPEFSLAVPNRVQGITRLDNGNIALSVSYGRKNYSYLYIYENVLINETEYLYVIDNREISVYFLSDEYKHDELILPPMLEGIDLKDDKVLGIFESGAQKYDDAKYIENNICELY